MSDEDRTRRRFLGSVATAIGGGAAGCAAPLGSRGATRTTEGRSTPRPPPASPTGWDTPSGASGTAYTRVYRRIVGSVVQIRAFVGGEVGQGSGFVYPDAGILLTNEHVVGGADALEVRFDRGEWRTGEILGTDAYSDLAVVRVDSAPGYASPLPLVSERPVVGQQVVAVGSPFGLEKSLSVGVVSGLNRSISTEGGFSIPGAVQTDAAVNPGNSGGPLVTLDGRVVGVIRSGGGENIGFAVSAPLVRRVVPALRERGEYVHPYMGVFLATVTPSVARANDLDEPGGVLVVDVMDGGPSDGVLRESTGEREINGVSVPTGGDVVVALDGEPIASLAGLSGFLAFRAGPGQTIDVSVIRDGRRRQVELTLGERPPP